MTDEKPRYPHACPRCIFLGELANSDLYGCFDHRGYEYGEDGAFRDTLLFVVRYSDGTWSAYPREALGDHLPRHKEAAKLWDMREPVMGIMRVMPADLPGPMIRLDQHGNLVGWRCPACGALNNPALPQCLCGGKTPEEKEEVEP